MTNVFQPKTLSIPTYLTDGAMQERLKQFSSNAKTMQQAAPPPAAIGMADRIQREYLDQPIRKALRASTAILPGPLATGANAIASAVGGSGGASRSPRLAEQDRLMNMRSDMLTEGLGDGSTLGSSAARNLILGPIGAAIGEGGPIAKMGALTPEEAQAEAERRAQIAKDGVAAEQALQQAARQNAQDLGFGQDMIATEAEEADIQAHNRLREKDVAEKQAAVTDPSKQPTQTWWLDAVQGAGNGLLNTLIGAGVGAASLYEMATLQEERSDVRAWMETAEMTVNKLLPGDKARAKDFLSEMAKGGGSMAGFLLGGALFSAIGAPITAGTTITGALLGGGAGYRDAEKFNATQFQKYMSFFLNAGLGATEAVPLNRAFLRMNTMSGGLIQRMLTASKASALDEFIQEVGQAFGADVFARVLYDENREFDIDSYLRQGLVGGALGGLLGAGTAGLAGRARAAGQRDEEGEQNTDAQTEQLLSNTMQQLQERFEEVTVLPTLEITPEDLDIVDAIRTPLPEIDTTTAVVQGPGGSIPVGEDGMLELTHWSGMPLDVIDPAQRGTGPLRGAERTRLFGEDAVDRSYYGVGDPDFAEKFRERLKTLPPRQRGFMQRTDPYQREPLGSIRHTVKVDPNTLYNLYEDPLNLKAQLDEALQGGERITRLERLVRDAGFKGVYLRESPHGQTAMLFEPATPTRVFDERYGMDAKDVAKPEDFDNLTPETFAKGGWGVVTGVQEAQGDFNSPANVAAQDQLRRYLDKNKIPYREVGGVYKGVDQGTSFLVFAPEKKIREIGKRYKQESILTRRGLEYTDGSNRVTPINPAANIVGPGATQQDFYSTLEGTPFSLGLDFDSTFDESIVSVHPSQVQLEPHDTERLGGLPDNSTGPIERVVRAARAYAQSMGLPLRRQSEYVKVDPERAARIAEAYEQMEHNPADPEVAAAYEAMIAETLAQYQFVKASGLKIEFIAEGQEDPYAGDLKAVLRDIDAGHLWVFPTDQGFGSVGEAASDNPLLRPTDEYIGDRQLLANDVFRIVHDFFGHGIEGSGFGARGEENAWQSHMRLYTEEALPAVTSETRGQNSWVNYGPYGEQNRKDPANTVFAEQKTGIMPEWTWREGVYDDFATADEGDILGMRSPEDPARIAKLMDEVPGLKSVYRFMQPDERAKLNKRNAARVVELFESFPSAEEMASVAVSGRAKRGWYQRSAKALVDIFGMRDAPRFTALLAALSPQTSVESNAVNALRMWSNWIKAGRPTQPERIKQLLGMSVQGSKGEDSVLPAWIPNTITALTEPDELAITLSGPKVDSFMRNLQGATNEVTNDAWMANYANVDQTLFKKTGQSPGKGPGYVAMSAAVRQAANIASELTGDLWTPAEVQETVWSWAKTLYEMGGKDVSAVELLEAGGLTAEAIGATPDFATLFTSGVYRNILEQAGFNVDTLTESLGGADSLDGSGGDPLVPEGATIDQRTYERHLKDAARRLDALRERRAQTEGEQEAAFEIEDTFFPGEDPAAPEFADLTEDDFIALDDLYGQRASVTETPEFKAWFGDSKVVDADGNPVVVYHGTARSGFTSFDTYAGKYGLMGAGSYFTEDPAVASEYTDKGAAAMERRGDTPTPGVYNVYLSISNPIDMDAPADVSKWLEAFPEYINALDFDGVPRDFGGATNEDMLREVEEGLIDEHLPSYEGVEIVQSGLEGMGFDGVTHIGGGRVNKDGVRHRVWVAFHPEQIKSAHNRGTFDVNDPDIYAATASNRPSYKAEQKRPQRGVPTDPNNPVETIKLSDIGANLIRVMDLTVRQGRFTLKGKNVMGQYSRKQGVIRVKTMNDLSTLVHEAGHAMHMAANSTLDAFVSANKAAFERVATSLYGGDVTKLTPEQHRAEGFAEFFRVYTLNRPFAEKKYAQLVQGFDALLDQHQPGLREQLGIIGQQFNLWLMLPSTKLVQSMVVSGVQPSAFEESVKELKENGFGTWFHEYARSAVTATVNRFAPLNDLVSQILNEAQENRGQALDLKRAEDPRVLIRLAHNSGARGMTQVMDGVMGYRSTTPTSRSLRDAMLRYHGLGPDDNLSAIDPERQQAFAAYLIALRGLDEYRRMDEGKLDRPPLQATRGDLARTIAETEAQYGQDFIEAAKIVHEYSMALWEKSYRAGLIEREVYKQGLDRQFYAPLQRDMSDRMARPGISASAPGEGRSIVNKFRGSDRNVIDPMDALMTKTFALEAAIAENEVKLALAKLADNAGQVGALVERVPAQQLIGRQYGVQEVARQLTSDPNMTEADAQDLMDILDSAIEDDRTLSLFRSEQASKKGENIIFFRENGKLAALQLNDSDLGADVVNTLNAVGPENMPLLVDLVSHTSTMFRAAITSWPDFLVVNFIRDQLSAWILNDVGYKPFVTGLRGVGDELRQSDWARQYNAAMGLMGGMNSAALHEARVDRDLNALRKKGYLPRAFSGGGVRGAIKGLSRVVEMTETGSRLGIFRNAYERAKADGLSDWEASIEAAYMATDYMDFGLNGSRMTMHRRLIPFLNAQLQGLYKLMRTLGADEVRQRKGLMFVLRAYMKDINGLDLSRTEKQALRTGRKAFVKMASLGLISAALALVYADDPDYQDASEYLRATGWVIPMGEGRIFYIPKPFELALFANFTERAIESASGDDEALARFRRALALNLTPPTSPPLVQTAVELAANYDFFTGTDIVPDHMRALAPELQYNRQTTAFAKQLGETMGWSPMIVDHVMSGMFASAYRDLTAMYNATDPNRPTTDVTERPFTRRFVRDARRGAASAQDFWKFASMTDGLLRRAEVTYKSFVEAGKLQAANAFLDTLDEDQKAYAILTTHFEAEAKRLNPFYRARQLATITSAMRREMVSELGLEDSSNKYAKPIMLSAKEKKEADLLLSELIRREARNTLIYARAPGWENKRPLPTQPTLQLLRAVEPRVAAEFQRRVKKAKVYNEKVVNDYWPEVKDRLIRDREKTFLNDVLAVAKAIP